MRIRTESDKPRIIGRQLAAYKRHLDSFNHKAHLHWLNSSVYRYFGMDFFHDGAIEEFQFSPDFRTLSFRIMAPYIAHREDSSKNTYAWFRCEFSGIGFFQLAACRVDKLNDPLGPRMENVEFNISEINTMKKEIEFFKKHFRQQFMSLIVDTHPTERSFAIIFTKSHIEPEEPLAFDALQHRDEHELYLYQPPRKQQAE